MTFGSLFAGIGGMDLGLERAGMKCAWQVEIDPYCQRVLAKHWPDVPKHLDVREVGGHNLETVDLICGGFPCQDISVGGHREGINGERSGLWVEFARIIRELRPRFVIVENVGDLLVRGAGRVFGDLAALGMDAEWQSIPACALGLPQRRERLFIVAHTVGVGRQAHSGVLGADPRRCELEKVGQLGWLSRIERGRGGGVWPVPISGLHGVADGAARRLDAARLKPLGNAVVPQVAEFIGRRIMEAA